jgi:hypothetical protein
MVPPDGKPLSVACPIPQRNVYLRIGLFISIQSDRQVIPPLAILQFSMPNALIRHHD